MWKVFNCGPTPGISDIRRIMPDKGHRITCRLIQHDQVETYKQYYHISTFLVNHWHADSKIRGCGYLRKYNQALVSKVRLDSNLGSYWWCWAVINISITGGSNSEYVIVKYPRWFHFTLEISNLIPFTVLKSLFFLIQGSYFIKISWLSFKRFFLPSILYFI